MTDTYRVERKRRPFIHTKIDRNVRLGDYYSSGIELTLTREGVAVFGYFDTMCGIEGYTIPWAALDAERAEVQAPALADSLALLEELKRAVREAPPELSLSELRIMYKGRLQYAVNVLK